MKTPGENEPRPKPRVEVLVGREAQDAIARADDARELVRNLLGFTFSERPDIQPGMSRGEIAAELERLGYPTSILRPGADPPTSDDIDFAALESCVAERQGGQELDTAEHVVRMTRDGEMIVATIDGKPAGMIGLRRLGLFEGREYYECPRLSVLPGYPQERIFALLYAKVRDIIRKEAKNPMMLVHSKRPSVLAWARNRKHQDITFEQYFQRRNIPSQNVVGWKKIWEEDGWEYVEVDLLSEKLPKGNGEGVPE
ncbi:MAG TPA: hypothetical protein PKV72_06530 [Candidatus Peribacteria bacterium]|nr:hypothetical protein [Candidatus Peribacteria bacterium]